jgi:hypothetical protein
VLVGYRVGGASDVHEPLIIQYAIPVKARRCRDGEVLTCVRAAWEIVAWVRGGFDTGDPDTIAANASTPPATNIVTLSHHLAFRRRA